MNVFFKNKLYKDMGINRMLEPVLRIREILVWIRIRIRGFEPLTNGSESRFGSGSGSGFGSGGSSSLRH
jgi:hypothetical protein